MKQVSVCFFLWLLSFSVNAIASDEIAVKFWSQVVGNAVTPVDGHFIVDIKRTSGALDEPKVMRTTIEYWVRGSDTRFDVNDQAGRDIHSQVVLKNRGEKVLDNFDLTNDRVVVGQSAQGSKLAENARSSWLYFQTLLGRFPFPPLALYEESFEEFSGLSDAGSVESTLKGDSRLLTFLFSNGRSLKYIFQDSGLNPQVVEVLNKEGGVVTRLTTEWRLFSSTGSRPVAHSGVLESMNAEGAVSGQYEWNHVLVEDIPVASDPFTWDAMSVAAGKKRIITDADGLDLNGGYWDGKAFSETPLTISSVPPFRKLVVWLSVIGLGIGLVLFVLKLVFHSKGLMK